MPRTLQPTSAMSAPNSSSGRKLSRSPASVRVRKLSSPFRLSNERLQKMSEDERKQWTKEYPDEAANVRRLSVCVCVRVCVCVCACVRLCVYICV